MFFNKYPYTDFSQINLDWLMRRIMELIEKAGRVKTVAGISPDQSGNVPADRLKAALDVQPGGDGGVFVVNVDYTNIGGEGYPIMDQTWEDIRSAVLAGKVVNILWEQNSSDDWISVLPLMDIAAGGEFYTVTVLRPAEDNAVETEIYYAATASDYPCTHHSGPK